MADFKIYLGNKNYSSWSLRGWLILRQSGADFEEEVIPLRERNTRETILRYSPSGRVPVLHHAGIRVWDSLAIGEYLNELFPAAGLWPADTDARRLARSVSAEMHAGFDALRENMPMNVRRAAPGLGMTSQVQEDINRITAIWRDCRDRFGAQADSDDGFLFGRFTIADAMYAPVVSRFLTYGVDVDETSRAYMEVVWQTDAMKEWRRDSNDEPQFIEEVEI